MIKGKSSQSQQAKANVEYSFVKSSSDFSFAKAGIDYSVAKAVIKYSLATAYSYLDEAGLNKVYKDIVHSMDSILVQTNFGRFFDDTQNINTQTIIDTAKVLVDVFSADDVFSRTTSYNRSFSETQNQSDTISYIDIIKLIADSSIPSDRISSFDITKRLSEIVGSIDSKTFSVVKRAFDQALATDRATISFGKRPSDSQTQTDNFNRTVAYNRTYADSQTQTDSLSRIVSYDRNFSDIVTIPDQIVSIFFSDEGDIVDPFAVSDQTLLSLIKPMQGDTYSGFTDQYSSSFSTTKTDTSTPTDSFSRIANYLRSFAETKVLTDNFTRTVSFNRTFDEPQLTVDSLSRIVQFIRSYSDTQTQTDNASLSYSANKQDTQTNEDDNSKDFSKLLPSIEKYSVQFDGVDDYLSVQNDAVLQLGTGDFTIELWVYLDDTTNTSKYLISNKNTGGLSVYINSSFNISVYIGSNTASLGGNIPQKTWTNITLTRHNGSLRFFKNGNLIGVPTVFNGNANNAADLYIGARPSTSGPQNFFKGKISNLRITKDEALYLSGFSVETSPLVAGSNTSLLTCQSETFVDNSVNNLIIQDHNGASTVPLSPFSTEILPDPVLTSEEISQIDTDVVLDGDNQEQTDDTTVDTDVVLDGDNQDQSDNTQLQYSTDKQDSQAIEDFSYNQTDKVFDTDTQYQSDELFRTNDYNRSFDDPQTQNDSISEIDTNKVLEDLVYTSELIDILYIIGRIFEDFQPSADNFNRTVSYNRDYQDNYDVVDSKTIDFVQGGHSETIYSDLDLATIQYYKYLNESLSQQDSGSLITSDYVTNVGDYFAEYYVGNVRTFN